MKPHFLIKCTRNHIPFICTNSSDNIISTDTNSYHSQKIIIQIPVTKFFQFSAVAKFAWNQLTEMTECFYALFVYCGGFCSVKYFFANLRVNLQLYACASDRQFQHFNSETAIYLVII